MDAVAEVVTGRLLTEHGFAHAFSTRRGGVGLAPFDTLNFGRAVGDDADTVAENHRRLAARARYRVERLFETSQVHGTQVHVLDGASVEETRRIEADALVAMREGDVVGVRTADCVPVLLADPMGGAVAAIHAGWRGVAARIVPAAVARFVGVTGAPATRILVAIGPHIRTAAFEVGDDVARALAESSEAAVVVPGANGGKPHVDLARAVRVQLAQAGVVGSHVEDTGGCAHDEPARFFSFRRDGQRSGRMLSVIAVREER